MKSDSKVEVSLDFVQISSIVGALRDVVIRYIKKEFAEDFNYIEKVKHATLDETLEKFFNEKKIKSGLESYQKKGVMKARMNYALNFLNKAGSYVGASKADIKIWRIEHIQYFADKAKLLSDLLNKLFVIQASSQHMNQLCAELTELKNSVDALAKTRNDQGVVVNVGGVSKPVQGMLGTNNKSSLINGIQLQLKSIDIDSITLQLNKVLCQLQPRKNGAHQTASLEQRQLIGDDTLLVKKKITKVSKGDDCQHFDKVSGHDDYDEAGFTPLHHAIKNHDLNEVKHLLIEGANANKPVLLRGYSPLFLAVAEAKLQHDEVRYQIVAELLTYKADVNKIITEYAKGKNEPILKCNLLHYLLFNESSKGPQSRNLTKNPNVAVIELLLKFDIDAQAVPQSDPEGVACKNLNWYTHELERQKCRNKQAHINIIEIIKSAQANQLNSLKL